MLATTRRAPTAQTRPAAGSGATLEFRRVSKRYSGSSSLALQDVSFAIGAGEICTLVGPSGCGKTTAMRLINRMIDLTDGEILLDGVNIEQRDPVQLRREIGYVIQQVGLFPHLTVAQNIGYVPHMLGWSRREVAARVEELLDLVGLPREMGSRYPREVSGGQAQRVGVARALAANPPLMLADEPFGAIDPVVRARLQDEFLRLQREVGKTVVFVTHDIDEAIKMGHRIAVFQAGGRLAQFGRPEVILANPANAFVAEFVGADRGLKQLTLKTVAGLALAPAPTARPGDAAEPARLRGRESPLGAVIVVDEDDRPLARIPVDRLEGDRVPDIRGPVEPVLQGDCSLRDALSAVMVDGGAGVLSVGPSGAVLGVITFEALCRELGGENRPASDVSKPAARSLR